MIVTVPFEIPVTNPVFETVAIAGFELTHGLFGLGVPEPVSCVVFPEQIARFPLMVGESTASNE